MVLSTSFRTLASVSECSSHRFCFSKSNVFEENGRIEDIDEIRTENAVDLIFPALWLKSPPILYSGSVMEFRGFEVALFRSKSALVSNFKIDNASIAYLAHLRGQTSSPPQWQIAIAMLAHLILGS